MSRPLNAQLHGSGSKQEDGDGGADVIAVPPPPPPHLAWAISGVQKASSNDDPLGIIKHLNTQAGVWTVANGARSEDSQTGPSTRWRWGWSDESLCA